MTLHPLIEEPKSATEKQLVGMLRTRYEQDSGNGPQGAVIAQVRDAAGFDAKRTIDAIAVSFWPSRGLSLEAFECKSSRSDFKRELASPAKAERFCELVDRFWIVAGNKDVVPDPAELPAPWGLLVAKGGKLVQVKAAVELRASGTGRGARPLPPGFDRGFLVALIRQCHRLAGVKSDEVLKAEREGFEKGVEHGERSAGRELESLRSRMEEVRSFEEGLGMRVGAHRTWGPRATDHTAKQVGALVKMVLDGDNDVTGLRNRLSAAAREAERLASDAQKRLEVLDEAIAAQDALTNQLTLKPEAEAA